MSIIACPHCRKSIHFGPVEPPSGSDRAVGTAELRAINELMREHPAGRHTVAEIHAFYLLHQEAFGWPKGLTKAAIGRGLRANGATPWRNAMGRGWEIPKIPRERPAKPSAAIQADEEHQSYLETVRENGGLPRNGRTRRQELEELPFAIELPDEDEA